MRCNYNGDDYLFILKNDKYETGEELRSEFWVYNNKLDLGWESDFTFDNKEVHILSTFRDKFQYLMATMHEDTMLLNLLRELFPELWNVEIELPEGRYGKGRNIFKWMDEYNFNLKEFLTNKKYIVISDSHDSVATIFDALGLFDWDNIADSSVI